MKDDLEAVIDINMNTVAQVIEKNNYDDAAVNSELVDIFPVLSDKHTLELLYRQMELDLVVCRDGKAVSVEHTITVSTHKILGQYLRKLDPNIDRYGELRRYGDEENVSIR